MIPIVDQLMRSEEPGVRYKVLVGVLGADPVSVEVRQVQREIEASPRVQQLLSGRRSDGLIEPVNHVYSKWKGAHWVLGTLADIGYPSGDESLRPAMGQVLEHWLQPFYFKELVTQKAPPAQQRTGVLVMQGRARRCASQQGLALFSAMRLGLVDERVHQLVERLLHWQWPDGGWNCDREPEAVNSSFWETAIPLRGLAAYARLTDDPLAWQAVRRAGEVFLERRLFRRRSDSAVMNPQFVLLHYPCYWHYDILHGLKIMAEASLIGDPRCQEPLDLLESKRLPDGGWAAEERFYRTTDDQKSGVEIVKWGVVGKSSLNEWVTADALTVMKAAGRLD
jgi:hypothetical protein